MLTFKGFDVIGANGSDPNKSVAPPVLLGVAIFGGGATKKKKN
jgi:hypothetical protein